MNPPAGGAPASLPLIARPLPGILLCVLLALVFHLNVLQNGYGWDDEKIIGGIRGSVSLSDVFLPPTPSHAAYYRPLIGLSYRLDHALWGKDPFGYHLSVLLAHLLNSALVFLLARSLLSFSRPLPAPDSLLPILSASLFAVHPAHSEAVAWIAGRNDVFCTGFILLSSLLYLRFRRQESSMALILSMLFFAAALLTKEVALGLLFVFPLLGALTVKNRPGLSPGVFLRSRPLHLLAPLAVTAVYYGLRAQSLASPYTGSSSTSPFETLSFVHLVPVAGYYIKTLLVPFPQRVYITEVPSSAPFFVFSLLVLAAFIPAFIRSVRRADPWVGTGLLWFAGFLGPALAIPLLGLGATTPLADRYLYAPSIGFLFVVSALWIGRVGRAYRPGLNPPLALWLVPALLIVLLGGMSHVRNTAWQNPLSFWSRAVESLEGTGRGTAIAYDNLGTARTNAGAWREAEEAYREAIRLRPDFPQAHNNLGVLYKFMGRQDADYFKKALIESHEALRLDPDSAEARNNLGDVYALQGRLDDAIREYEAVLRVDPGNARVHNNLGGIYQVRGSYDEAIRARRLALERDPDLVEARVNIGNIYLETGEPERAIAEYEKALATQPSNPLAAYGAGLAYKRTGDLTRAREAFARVLRMDPDHALAREALRQLND